MRFPRKTHPDGRRHSEQWALGFAACESYYAGVIEWADAYIGLLEKRLRSLEHGEKHCSCGQQKCKDCERR